jgi:putative hydrolase of the HAD superfamily
MPPDAPHALLFDLGGVVIDIDIERMLRHWMPHSRLSIREMRQRLHMDEPFRQHERGELDAASYMAHLAASFELEADADTVAVGWNAILVDEISSTLDLIERLRERVPCYAFSNTSAIHRDVWSSRFPRVTTMFQRLFLSFELGLRKPERAAFDTVASAIGVTPESILFFDDTEENVDGARAAGFDTVHVQTPRDVHAALVERGLIRAGGD